MISQKVRPQIVLVMLTCFRKMICFFQTSLFVFNNNYLGMLKQHAKYIMVGELSKIS